MTVSNQTVFQHFGRGTHDKGGDRYWKREHYRMNRYDCRKPVLEQCIFVGVDRAYFGNLRRYPYNVRKVRVEEAATMVVVLLRCVNMLEWCLQKGKEEERNHGNGSATIHESIVAWCCNTFTMISDPRKIAWRTVAPCVRMGCEILTRVRCSKSFKPKAVVRERT